VDLGRDPAAGPAQGIQINPPFLAPALCWCAPSRACLHALPGNGITVLSIIWIVRSPAPLATSASRIASNIPASRHRANLRQTVFHLPKRSDRSRHGEPVRAIQKIPSRTRRLSIEGQHARPRSDGRNGASSAQARVVDEVSVQGWLPISSLESCRWGYGYPLCPHGLAPRWHQCLCLCLCLCVGCRAALCLQFVCGVDS
jgi:hypothetical protein